ncbi:MAG: hypothetical protein JST69_14305, partial [Bacteroidetes bacterium]|nr:hypothetical protein [Bacteroidota bacterium]
MQEIFSNGDNRDKISTEFSARARNAYLELSSCDAALAAYINYILFDQYYNVVNAGWTVVPTGAFSQQHVSIPTLT